ncbi:hypothetical protein [Streptomyces sp. NPDC097619]|uniref:hypothetical protein n=1 Tax=Streptomyces sp. NPDC097619 TaxID=3157228 RepID=UPI00332842BA
MSFRSVRSGRSLRSATTAVVASALAAAGIAALTAPASAAPAGTSAGASVGASAPGFLKATDLPPHPSSPWSAGPVRSGLPENPLFCLKGALPAAGSWHRLFGTEMDASARQVSVRAGSTAKAKALAAALEKKAAACAADWLRKTPGGLASWQDYGKLNVEEGAHVYGVHTAVPDSEHGVHLFGIGRDGTTVTVVNWSQMGTLTDAPIAAFKKTTTTAVKKLNP